MHAAVTALHSVTPSLLLLHCEDHLLHAGPLGRGSELAQFALKVCITSTVT